MGVRGWYRERRRHSLAARGIKTSTQPPRGKVNYRYTPSKPSHTYRPTPAEPLMPPVVKERLEKDIKNKLDITDDSYDKKEEFEIGVKPRLDAVKAGDEWRKRGHYVHLVPDQDVIDMYHIFVKKPK